MTHFSFHDTADKGSLFDLEKNCIFEYMYIQGLQLAMEVNPAGPMSTS